MKKPEKHGPGDPSRGWNPAIDSTAPAAPTARATPATPATRAEVLPPTPPVFPGARVLNYIVEHLIGEGGMGAVWRVRQKMLKVPRAMKVLKPGFASVERFEEEMEMLAMVSHDNVVKVIDSGVLADGSLFYVMEHVEGRSLEADIAKHRGQRPQWEYIREIILQICDGLAAIHDRGIIHRDMKPANCMLSPDVGETVRVKIVDLGVARRSSVIRPGSTSDGMFIGSAAYASPEQAAGETKTLTYGSDVYSVGIMLYELLTGIVPHVSDGSLDRAAMLRRRVIGTLPPPPSLRVRPGTLPPEIDEIIVRALQPDPRDRFQTVAELAEAIRQTPALPRQLRRTRPSQSLTTVPLDVLASDSSPGLGLASQSHSGLRVLPSQSHSGLRVPPSQSSTALRSNPPSQSSPGLAPVSAPALDISTLIAARAPRPAWRLALLAGVVVVLTGLVAALPDVRARIFGAGDPAATADVDEPPAFARARAAIHRLGLQESQDVQAALQQIGEDPGQPPELVAAARLLEAELVLMRALACQISVALEPAPGPAQIHVQADPARAVALLRELPPDHDPAAQARVRALLRLVQGERVDAPDPDLAAHDLDELRALADAAPMWRDAPAEPATLIPPLQRLRSPSTLVRSVLALGLWRSGEDAQAHRLLVATLKMASDQPAARAIFDALLRSNDGEPLPDPPPAPPATDDPPSAPADDARPAPPATKSAPRPPAERFASLAEQIEAGCQRVERGDRTGVRLLMDAHSQSAEHETNFDLCFCLGQGFTRQKAHDVALQWYRRALTIEPGHPDALAGAARAADVLGRDAVALEFYRRLLDVDPRNAAAHAYLTEHDPSPSPEEVGPLLPVDDGAAKPPG